MKRDFLKSLELSDEQINLIMSEYGKSVTDIKAKTLEYSEKIRELEALNRNLELAQNDVSDYNELKTKFQTLETEKLEIETKHLEEISKLNLDSAIKSKIGTSAHDFDWLKSNLELEKIKFTNGELNGLDEQLNMLKENKPFLFALEQKKPEITGVTPAKTWEESKPQDAFLANLVSK